MNIKTFSVLFIEITKLPHEEFFLNSLQNVFLYSYCLFRFLSSSFVVVIPISLGLTGERIDKFSLISGWFLFIYFLFLSDLVTEKVCLIGSQKAGWVGQLCRLVIEVYWIIMLIRMRFGIKRGGGDSGWFE